jgi:hypothetical protein
LYAGLAAQIPLNGILCFYAAVAASCALFYSGAMLFGLTTSWLGGFQPWLASATVCVVVYGISVSLEFTRGASDLLTFLSPLAILRYLLFGVVHKEHPFNWSVANLDKLQWFNLPVGTNIASGLAMSLLVCGSGTYWLWQGWQRRFPNPSATVLSKRQSYLLVICCQPIILGFALQSNPIGYKKLADLLIWNLLMFLALIAALTSERQSLYDWARYRKQIVPSSQKLWRRYPLLDLIWSEKSPAVVAIAINCLSSVIILTPWMLLEKVETGIFWGVIYFCCLNLILIYAAIAQVFLFTKTRNPEIWAVGTVGSAILLPPVILWLLLTNKVPFLWLSSTFAAFWPSSYLGESENTILLSILSQWTVLLLLNLKLRSQLKLAGESASKALVKA